MKDKWDKSNYLALYYLLSAYMGDYCESAKMDNLMITYLSEVVNPLISLKDGFVVLQMENQKLG